jgi:hypothetical protein
LQRAKGRELRANLVNAVEARDTKVFEEIQQVELRLPIGFSASLSEGDTP